MASPRDLVIRAATRSDLPALGRLGAALMRTHHAFDPLRFFPPGDDAGHGYAWFLGTQLEGSETRVLVAERAGSVLGYVYAAIEPRSWQMLLDEAGVIHDVIVNEQARGQGIATALVEAALAWMQDRGVPRVVLHTAEHNADAQRIFARLGFRRTMIEMTREIAGARQDDDPEAGRRPAREAVGAHTVRLLGEADVASLVSMDEVIDAMKGALAGFSAGEVVQPVRLVLPLRERRGFLGLMPAQLREPDALGAKLVTVVPDNAQLGVPTHAAAIVLFDPHTGRLMSVMDGRLITEIRTAAVSALSALLLARKETSVLGILGSGVQARSHLEALERARVFEEVRVWSPTPGHRAAFVAAMAPRAVAPLVASGTAEEAVRGADIVVLATSSARPVVESAWIRDGAHVVSVGACRPDQREMDPALVARSRVYVDSREAALVESGDLVQGIAEGRFDASHIVGEIGELLAGRIEGRRSASEVTVFKSLGLAVEDVATATLVYSRAVQRGAGTDHEL